MKPVHKSVENQIIAVVTLLGVALLVFAFVIGGDDSATAAARAGGLLAQIPAAVGAIGGVVALAGGLLLKRRVDDKRRYDAQHDTRSHAYPPAPLDRRAPRGFATVDVALGLAATALVAALLCGCPRAVYSKACTLEEQPAGGRAWVCRGRVLVERISPHPDGRPTPAGRAEWLLDGERLPLTVDVDQVELPR